jgi:hypothetical protein
MLFSLRMAAMMSRALPFSPEAMVAVVRLGISERGGCVVAGD